MTNEELLVEDKPQFEVGKWYKVIWTIRNNKFIYIKPTSIDEHINCNGQTSIWFDLNNGGSIIHHNSGYYLSHLKDPQLVTNLSEIQQYLPDGHPDKINVSVFVPKFRKGDIIEVCTPFYNCNMATGAIAKAVDDSHMQNKWCKDEVVDIVWIKPVWKYQDANQHCQNEGEYFVKDFKLSNYSYPPGYIASIKEDLIKNNNLKTSNNEETSKHETGNICKVSRFNSSKIGSSDITRGTAIKSSSSKSKIGSGYCYH